LGADTAWRSCSRPHASSTPGKPAWRWHGLAETVSGCADELARCEAPTTGFAPFPCFAAETVRFRTRLATTNRNPSAQAVTVANIPPQLADALQDRYEIERELGRGGMATVRRDDGHELGAEPNHSGPSVDPRDHWAPCYAPFTAGASLPDRLRTCRRLCGLSQNRLAPLLQVNESTLARWERGTRRPTHVLLKRVETFLASQPPIAGCRRTTPAGITRRSHGPPTCPQDVRRLRDKQAAVPTWMSRVHGAWLTSGRGMGGKRSTSVVTRILGSTRSFKGPDRPMTSPRPGNSTARRWIP